jgi:hypothetical protein
LFDTRATVGRLERAVMLAVDLQATSRPPAHIVAR